jgi:hypothetical protein
MSNNRSDGSWHYSGIKRRDFKHDASGPEIIRPIVRKNTKKWCKGKVGKEHDYKPKSHWMFFGSIYIMFKCLICGKERYERYESWPKEIPVPGLWDRHG